MHVGYLSANARPSYAHHELNRQLTGLALGTEDLYCDCLRSGFLQWASQVNPIWWIWPNLAIVPWTELVVWNNRPIYTPTLTSTVDCRGIIGLSNPSSMMTMVVDSLAFPNLL